ncbi:putative porin [Woeseia oceani]|uniref:putative porin n=1 Tax=Woeseia oceani TaxID=1548547 RepID=UPI000A56AE6D|nr:putative porin [Woeseia oceani]
MNHGLRASCAAIVLILLSTSGVSAEFASQDRITFEGDFRLRYENIDAEGSPQVDRSRLRARFGFAAKVADDLKIVLGVATGNGSPVSTNVTLDGGFSAKDITLNRAYVDWQLNDQWALHGGKIKSPWVRPGGSSLIWDADLNPEGLAGHFRSGEYFASFAALSVDARSAADDSLLFTAQAGRKFLLSEKQTLTAGLGYYAYTNTVGSTPFYDGAAAGNSVDLAGNYLNDYRLLELFAEYKTMLNDLPVTVYADVVQNTAVSVEDTGYAIGVAFGSANAPGKSQFAYAWHDTEADAVVGTYNDSDFANGVTDAAGHFIKAKYAIRDNVKLGGTLIIARHGGYTGDERDYDRIMIDLEFEFE